MPKSHIPSETLAPPGSGEEIMESILKDSKPTRRLFLVVVFSLSVIILMNCENPASVPEATPSPTASRPVEISALTVPSLELRKSFGNGAVRVGAWSLDGSLLALGTSLRVDLYDAHSFQPTGALDTGQEITDLAFSSDGKQLAVITRKGLIQIWDPNRALRVRTLEDAGVQMESVRVLFSPDNARLIVSTGQAIQIWEVSSGQLLDVFPGYIDGIRDLVLSPDGNLVVASSYNEIFVRDLTTRELRYPPLTLENRESIEAIFFEPGGKRFITVISESLYLMDNATPGIDYQNKIRYWNVSDGKPSEEITLGQSNIWGTAISQDGRLIALSGENAVDIWDTSAKKISFSMPAARIRNLAFSPDGSLLLALDGNPQVWDLSKCCPIQVFDQYSGNLSAAAFSPDGTLTAVVGNNIQVRELATGQVRYTFNGTHPLTFSPDGKLLAFASSKDAIALVDTQTGEGLPDGQDLEHSSSDGSFALANAKSGKQPAVDIPCPEVAAIAFSPSSDTIAYGGDGCMVTLRNVYSGEIIRTLDQAQEVNGRYYVKTLSYSPDGRKLIAAGGSTVEIWDLQTATLLQTIDGLIRDTQVVFSPDGRYLAVSGFDGYFGEAKVKIWDTTNNQVIYILTSSQLSVSSLAFSPDGQLLAIGGGLTYSEEAPKIELWDVWSGRPLMKLESSRYQIEGLAFSTDGRTLLGAKFDGSIQLWQVRSPAMAESNPRPTPTNLPTGLPTVALPTVQISKAIELGKGSSSSLYRSPDGKLAALVEGNFLKWYNAANMTFLGSIDVGDNFYAWITFSPDDKLIILESSFGAQVIELASQSVIGRLFGGNGSTDGYTFTKDGKYIAYRINDRTSGGPYGAIGLWNVEERKDVFGYNNPYPTLLSGRYHGVSEPAISPDGRLVAAGHSDHRVYVWDLYTGQTSFLLEGHAQAVTSVDFSPDGRFLASGSADGTIRLWNPDTGELVRVLTGFRHAIDRIKFNSNSRSLLVYTAYDQPPKIFNLQNSQITSAVMPQPTVDPFELQQYQQGYTKGYLNDLLFSPDGQTVAIAQDGVWLWDAATGKLLRYIDVSQYGGIYDLAFSPDSKRMAITAYDAALLILDVHNGRPVLTLQGRLEDGKVVYSATNKASSQMDNFYDFPHTMGLAFSSNGSLLAFGNETEIEIWDLGQAKKVLEFDSNLPDSSVTGLSFSKDGRSLFAILKVEDGRSAQVWSLETRQLLRKISLPDSTGYVYSASAFRAPLYARSNGDDTDNWVELWNLETGKDIKLDLSSQYINALTISPDGSLLAAIVNSKLCFWSTANGRLLYQSETDFYSSRQLDISPDNRTLAIDQDDKSELWDISQIAQLGQQAGMSSLAPLATATPALMAWPTATPQPTPSMTNGSRPSSPLAITQANAAQVQELSRFGRGTVERATWSPSGEIVAVAGSLGVFQYDTSLAESARLEVSGWTYNVAFLPDGRTLAASVDAGHVQVRDVASGKVLVDREGGGEPVISPDGKLLVYKNEDNNLQVWDMNRKQVVSTLYGEYHDLRRSVFSPDGKLVAAILGNEWSLNYANAVRVWDARSGVIVNALGGPDNDITDLSFSADGRFLTGAAGGSAWIWSLEPGVAPESIDLYRGEINGNLNIYVQTVTAASLSPDDQIVAVGTSERVIWLYNRQSHKVLRKLEGHAAALQHLQFSPDGKSLLAVDIDGAILIWDTALGKQIASLEAHAGIIRGLIFRQDGNLTAWQDGNTWILQPPDGKLLQATHIHGGTILAPSPAGDWLAVYDPFRVSLWDARTGKFHQKLEGEAEDPFVDYQFEGLVFRQFSAAAFSPDGTRLATAGTGGIWVYDTSDGKLLRQFRGTNATKLAFSPDGRWLITSIYEQVQPPSIYDLNTGSRVFDLDGFASYIGRNGFTQYAFSPDGRFVGTIRSNWESPDDLVLIDTVSQQVVKQIPLGGEITLTSLAFNPASSLVAVGQSDGRILMVDLTSMQVISTLPGHHGQVEHLAFSADGRYLATTSQDGTVRIWGIVP